MTHHAVDDLESAGSAFYRHAMEVLADHNLPFLVGGAYALECHTGIVRRTKDFDIFVRPRHARPVLKALSKFGYQSELTFSHWLGKAFHGDDFIDVIFSSGNGICTVDDEWFEHSLPGVVLGMELRLCPAEETIWQKAFILERDRCDTADVAHLLRATAERLDWDRLLRRFDRHWRVLYAHLVLFGFIYPHERHKIPAAVMDRLAERLFESDCQAGAEAVCQGTLLSATQYLRDIDYEGLSDSRLRPQGSMTSAQVNEWTANFMSG